MNKRKKITVNKVNKNNYKVINEVIFILLALISIVYFVALFTYDIFEDPATGGTILQEPINNAAGIMGAWISDISFAMLGYAAYVIPTSIFWLGYNFHKTTSFEHNSKLGVSIKLILYFIMLCAITAILTQHISANQINGGWLGELIHIDIFKDFLGGVATMVYAGVIMICFIIISGFSWFKFSSAFFAKAREQRLKKQNIVYR